MNIRKLGKVGSYSYCITIPKDIVQDLRWRTKQRVTVEREGDTIVIRDWKPNKKQTR